MPAPQKGPGQLPHGACVQSSGDKSSGTHQRRSQSPPGCHCQVRREERRPGQHARARTRVWGWQYSPTPASPRSLQREAWSPSRRTLATTHRGGAATRPGAALVAVVGVPAGPVGRPVAGPPPVPGARGSIAVLAEGGTPLLAAVGGSVVVLPVPPLVGQAVVASGAGSAGGRLPAGRVVQSPVALPAVGPPPLPSVAQVRVWLGGAVPLTVVHLGWDTERPLGTAAPRRRPLFCRAAPPRVCEVKNSEVTQAPGSQRETPFPARPGLVGTGAGAPVLGSSALDRGARD